MSALSLREQAMNSRHLLPDNDFVCVTQQPEAATVVYLAASTESSCLEDEAGRPDIHPQAYTPRPAVPSLPHDDVGVRR